MTPTILKCGDCTSLARRIRENVRLQRCQIREVLLYHHPRIENLPRVIHVMGNGSGYQSIFSSQVIDIAVFLQSK